MKLSVVIVSYNVRYYLEQCLYSLRRSLNGVESEVFVIDNHSRDNSVGYLKERFPEVKFIASAHNLGFARANNIAIKQSSGYYVLLLNPDTIVGEDTIRHSLAFMDIHPDAGSLGVQMLKSDGTSAMESRRGLPTPMTAFYKMIGLCKYFPRHRKFGKYYMSCLPWDKPVEIDVVSGAYCLLRRRVLDEVGLLDEDFFMYGEDIDLSYRILKGDYHNWYLPYRILHYKGESTHKSSFRYVHVFYEAMLIFFRKHYGHLSLLLSIPIKLAIYIKAVFALVRMLYSKMRKSLGFSSIRPRKAADYVFIGPQKSMEHCRKIADINGLSASFYIADADSKPDGHLGLVTGKPDRITYIIYDVEAYSYDMIFELFSRCPMRNVFIGTYSRRTGKIITDSDVISLI